MKKAILFLFLSLSLSGCSGKKETDSKIPVIDIVNAIGNYQRVYCSDLFSSIEMIPLETGDDCLLAKVPFPNIILTDNIIFINSNVPGGYQQLYTFDDAGKLLNPIGRYGQGPGEYTASGRFFLNTDKPTIFVEDKNHILEYDFYGNHIRSFRRIVEEGTNLNNYAYVGDDIFVVNTLSYGKNPFKYYLLDRNGMIIKSFQNYIFYNKTGTWSTIYEGALTPVRVKERVYLKDVINDTVYVLKNMELQPAFVFELGKYAFPIESIEGPFGRPLHQRSLILHAIRFLPAATFVGTEKYLFYHVALPEAVPKPKTKPRYRPFTNEEASDDIGVYGIYNVEQQTNILLDTDSHLQKGIVNDLNGGLPFIPIYYAGNDLLVGIWWADDMKATLTDEYFAKQTIKDPQAHQKLKELLNILQDDDNPVVVVAKLK
jgi:hypothetical protein